MCQYEQPGPDDRANFLSLECAFGWLRSNYGQDYNIVVKVIAEDQDEPLPLNWAVLVEDWDITYWIIWTLILYVIWSREIGRLTLESPRLSGWVANWYR